MALSLYMDHNIPAPITEGVRGRGIDVLTAFEDGSHTLPDPEILDRAAVLGRALFTQDTDFLIEAARRQRTEEPFAGVIFVRQRNLSIGRCVDALENLAAAASTEDLANAVHYLPV